MNFVVQVGQPLVAALFVAIAFAVGDCCWFVGIEAVGEMQANLSEMMRRSIADLSERARSPGMCHEQVGSCWTGCLLMAFELRIDYDSHLAG